MKFFKDLFENAGYTPAELKRIIRLIPLLIGLGALAYFSGGTNKTILPVFVESKADSSSKVIYTTAPRGSQHNYAPEVDKSDKPAELFDFDPNTLALEGFVKLGFSSKQAQVIINYRTAGARFDQGEDFARCYSVSPQMFEKLEPYIKIRKTQQSAQQQPETVDSSAHSSRGLKLVLDTTSNNPFADYKARRESVDFPIEINSADSATLVLVTGIGPTTASRIVEYRKKLGGFASATQLSQVKGMTERNYLTILKEIYVDTCKIQKIDINFATPKQMSLHPYISPKGLAKLIKNRQLRGGWRTIEEFKEDKILKGDEFERLRPYLLFNAQHPKN